ncbi:TPA: N-acetylmuramoyl-L-alanine amidase family protein, partial [Clostridium perfringens]|nr:N-acetylmuramoyl-L-alanine amidase family protein [Clostridium perfringens]
GYWYYLEENGAMVTGWKKINNVWYYFYDNGVMR